MGVSLQIYTNWAAAQQTGEAVFQNQELGKDVAASDFLSRIRADCGAKDDSELPQDIRKAIVDAQIESGKPLTARAIKQVSTAALSWERDVNRLGNLIVDSNLSAEAKDGYLAALTTVKTSEQLGKLKNMIFMSEHKFGADELFPKLGRKDVCFMQSPGANTCFAMSVMNGCSQSDKISCHLNGKFSGLSGGLRLHYPKEGFKPVQIDQQYETQQVGKLGAFENSVVNYMCAADPAYRNEMSKRNSDSGLPLGNAVNFGKALGLVQNQPDVIISEQGENSDFLEAGVSAESRESVRNRIASQLQQGGVVTMNAGGDHYVAITDIKGNSVTVVDSKGKLTGIHDLREFTGEISDDYLRAYTFSFLDLPDENATDDFLKAARQSVTKENVLGRIAEHLGEKDKDQNTLLDRIVDLSKQLNISVDTDDEFDFEAVGNKILAEKNRAASACKNDKEQANRVKEPYEQLETALRQLKNIKDSIATVNRIGNFGEAVDTFVRYLGESSDGRQFAFDQLQKGGGEGELFDAFVDFVCR